MKAKKIIFIALAVLLQMVLCSCATVDLDGDMHPKKVTVKKVTGVKLVTLFILILAVTQHIH